MTEKTQKIPRHIAIIMDGNGRWAQERGLDRLEGHAQGVKSVKTTIKSCVKHGVAYLTIYAFSTENWGRPQYEVDGLMELFCKAVQSETSELAQTGVRIRIIGDRSKMSEKVREHLDVIEASTSQGEKLTVLIALNYGSREEITLAVRKIAEAAVSGEITPENITPESISSNLYTAQYPDPDLIVRTSGEQRLSNFMLWQAAYSELYFTTTYWPDFNEEAFEKALAEYADRERRFGLITKHDTIENDEK